MAPPVDSPAGDSRSAQLRAIVEHLADGVLIVDRGGRIRFANPAAESLFGRDAADLAGGEFGHPVIAGDTTEIEVVPAGGNGSTIAAELRAVKIDWEGEPALLVSLRDVTDRRRAEERARQLEGERVARADAEAANQAKSEFLAMMSHELRTPLNAVIGYADLLDLGIGGGELSAEQRHQLARIRASGRHLLGLVNEVLDLSKIEAGKLTVDERPGRAGDTADAAVALVQSRAEEKGIRIDATCLVNGDVYFLGDDDRVRQILVNLLANAVKFTPPGGAIAIECGKGHPPQSVGADGVPWAFIRVRDTGVGIPAARLGRIFDPFVQGESGHTRQNEGSGLGLTISRRLARLMHGDLTVESEEGHGSTFTLWLPVAQLALPAPAWSTMARPATSVRGLSDVGESMLRELSPLLDSFVHRLRSEEVVPAARRLRFSQLADHAASYLADLASTLVAIEEADGQAISSVTDSAEIQRVNAERHGMQRGRLGWTEQQLRRECEILREEIVRAIRRQGSAIPDAVQAEAITLLTRCVEQAETTAIRALMRSQSSTLEPRELPGGANRAASAMRQDSSV